MSVSQSGFCKYGFACTSKNCQRMHECPKGSGCIDDACPLKHIGQTARLCSHGSDCKYRKKGTCKFWHRDVEKEMCPYGFTCKYQKTCGKEHKCPNGACMDDTCIFAHDGQTSRICKNGSSCSFNAQGKCKWFHHSLNLEDQDRIDEYFFDMAQFYEDNKDDIAFHKFMNDVEEWCDPPIES